MEHHTYAKSGSKKWSVEEKRYLVKQRIAADHLFLKYSSKHAEPWKQFKQMACIGDYNEHDMRKQWLSMVQRYRVLKATVTTPMTPRIIDTLNTKFEFFAEIHAFMNQKTNDLHSYALKEPNVEQTNKLAITSVFSSDQIGQLSPHMVGVLTNPDFNGSSPNSSSKSVDLESLNNSPEERSSSLSDHPSWNMENVTVPAETNDNMNVKVEVEDDNDNNVEDDSNVEDESDDQMEELVHEIQSSDEELSEHSARSKDEDNFKQQFELAAAEPKDLMTFVLQSCKDKLSPFVRDFYQYIFNFCDVPNNGPLPAAPIELIQTPIETQQFNAPIEPPAKKPKIDEKSMYYQHRRSHDLRMEQYYSGICKVLGGVVNHFLPAVDVQPLMISPQSTPNAYESDDSDTQN